MYCPPFLIPEAISHSKYGRIKKGFTPVTLFEPKSNCSTLIQYAHTYMYSIHINWQS